MEKLIVKIAVLSNRLTLAGLLSLAVCAFAFYSFNSRSMADDFFRIAEIRSTSVFPRAIFEWNAFNPRFISMLIEYGLAKFEFLFIHHSLLMVIVYFSIFLIFFYILHIAIKNRLNAAIITLLLFSISQIFSRYGENLFFFTAVVEYFFPAVLCVAMSALTLNSLARPVHPALYIFSIALPLLHEAIGLVYLAILAGFFWINLWLKSDGQRVRLLSLLAALSLTGSTILAMMLSPGVARRMETSQPMPLGGAFAETWALLTPDLPYLLLAPVLALSLSAVLTVTPWQRALIEGLEARPWVRLHLLFGVIALATLVPLVLVTATFSGQGAAPRRLLDALFLIAFVATMGLTWLILPRAQSWRTALQLVAPIGVIAGLGLHPRPSALWSEASATVENRQTFDRRLALAHPYRGQAGRVIVTDRIWPVTVLPVYFDIGSDPRDYRNHHFAAFLGVTCVEHRLPQSGEPPSVVRSEAPCQP